MRAFGEWEKQDALLLALPHANSDWADDLDEILTSYVNLVEAASKYQKIIIISPKKEDFDQYFSKFDNVEFHQIETDDTWIRDYGAIDVDNEHGGIISYDFKFNAWGGKFKSSKDDEVNKKLFKLIGGKLVDVDMVLEGGSIDFNGDGAMLTTKSCLLNKNRNPNLSQDELDKKLKELFDLKQIIWLEHGFIEGDDTDSHVDTLARFMNENTIVYASCDDMDDLHYDELKLMESELKTTEFNLIALPLPKPVMHENRRLAATYINFIFINGALIVPTYGDENDNIVLKILADSFPDIDVIGIDSRVFIRQNGSLHCSSQNKFSKRAKI